MDTIRQTIRKIKSFISDYSEEVGVSLVVILVAFSSFFLGQFSIKSSLVSKNKISFEKDFIPTSATESAMQNSTTSTPVLNQNWSEEKEKSLSTLQADNKSQKGDIVASKNGKRYYYPWCGGISRISEKNKIYFASALEAEKFGLTLASGCSAK